MRPGFVRSITAWALGAWLGATSALAHAGKLDARGGHFDKKTGVYHFHKGASGPPHRVAEIRRPIADQTRAELFGSWTDGDQDCQSTRDEILVRDNRGKLVYASKESCRVIAGEWTCPYSGVKLQMATEIGIDHIVALAHAMDCGAAGWTREQRMTFANDPENLLAVERHINESKGSKGVVKWKPPEVDYWPEYARRWRAVKLKYGLTISALEEKHLRKMAD